jgi:hypothetical protein
VSKILATVFHDEDLQNKKKGLAKKDVKVIFESGSAGHEETQKYWEDNVHLNLNIDCAVHFPNFDVFFSDSNPKKANNRRNNDGKWKRENQVDQFNELGPRIPMSLI